MSKKKRSLPIVSVFLILFVSVLTSCDVQTQAVGYSNVEKQEWLAYVPEKLTVTNLKGEEKTITFGLRKNAVLNVLKSIRLENPSGTREISAGDTYSVNLEYTDVRIRYTFCGSELRLTVDGESARVYTIDSTVWNKIDQQLRDINPS